MQSESPYKIFPCSKHKNEIIQGLIIDHDNKPALKCFKCVVDDGETVKRYKLQTIDEYVSMAANYYQILGKVRKIDGNAAKEVLQILKNENQVLEDLSFHIGREKIKINENLNTMLENFVKSFTDAREEIFKTLDNQIIKFKKLYQNLRNKLDKYYIKVDSNSINPRKEDLIELTNACKTVDELERLILELNKDISEAKFFQESSQRIKQIEIEILDLGASINEQSIKHPLSFLGSLSYNVESSMRLFKENVKTFLNTLSYIDNVIDDKPRHATFVSKILKNTQDKARVLEWLHESGYRQPRLVYRGTRDGLNSFAFHKFCDDFSPTITIIRSNFGRTFGGFTDQTWNPTSSAKSSTFSWLFSLDEDKKFPIKKDFRYCAIFGKSDYGPTFGNAFDLYIAHDFTSDLCYSDLGRGYEAIGHSELENNCRLAGAYYFSVDEIEVFAFDDDEICKF